MLAWHWSERLENKDILYVSNRRSRNMNTKTFKKKPSENNGRGKSKGSKVNQGGTESETNYPGNTDPPQASAKTPVTNPVLKSPAE
jgi:hypothetical protein